MQPQEFSSQAHFSRWFLHRCVEEPDFHGGSFSLIKPSSPGKLFLIHATVMCGLMKTRMLRAPMGFRNDTVWTFGHGSWMNVWLGHTFFHQISQVPRPCEYARRTVWSPGRYATACASKHVVSARWRTTSFFTCGPKSSDQRFGQ